MPIVAVSVTATTAILVPLVAVPVAAAAMVLPVVIPIVAALVVAITITIAIPVPIILGRAFPIVSVDVPVITAVPVVSSAIVFLFALFVLWWRVGRNRARARVVFGFLLAGRFGRGSRSMARLFAFPRAAAFVVVVHRRVRGR